MGLFGKKKKQTEDEVYDAALKQTLESLKTIADNLEDTANDFKEQIETLKQINKAGNNG